MQQLKGKRQSHLWRAMQEVWPLLMQGTTWSLRSGQDTSFWGDIWLDSGVALKDLLPHEADQPDESILVAGMVDEDGRWDWNKFEHMLSHEMWIQIAGTVPPCRESGEDRTIWALEEDGCFRLRSAYALAAGFADEEEQRCWKVIWKWDGPSRVRHFLWLAYQSKLMTNEERKRRKLTTNSGCVRCPLIDEDILHVLRDCEMATVAWKELIPREKHQNFFSMPLQGWMEENLRDVN
ncbi:unnamed protein product [Linum trigynum]|uniref:Reverse transcriptase zinc-binding domain-containing protein n=1 Tax=Linum trigynum TaxID=586398 RepID=A0AAV2CTX7_9ROSI